MKIVCALCEQQGWPSYLGEHEPLDNPATTHGICARHREQALEALPSQSFPDAELLIVVRPNDTELYHYLLQRFADVFGVQIIQERRVAERPANDRVEEERRIRHGTVSSLGYTVVRFKRKLPRATSGAADAVNQDALRVLIRQKIQDGRLPRGRLPGALTEYPGDGSRCQGCDRIITTRELMVLLPLPEESPSQIRKTLFLHGDCFQIWSQANG